MSENEIDLCDKLIAIQNELCDKLTNLNFQEPIKYIYNPLDYARDLHETFVKKYFKNSTKKILFLGENPGPWGMCQTGICFGEINYVQNWLGVTGFVGKPKEEHPKKKIMGLNCKRSEISGKKFWGLFKELCGIPENFFKYSFVYNYCPIAFTSESGKNITPSDIKDHKIKNQLIEICNEAFVKIVKEFDFQNIIAIGRFAERVALKSLKEIKIENVKVIYIPHPSPRNAKQQNTWQETTLSILEKHDLLQYFEKEESTSPYFS